MRSYFDGLLRYFEFSGRTSRAQYWLYNLVTPSWSSPPWRTNINHRHIAAESNFSPLMIFLWLFHAIPGITITVRRLHDIGRSGWWYRLNFVPFAGLLVSSGCSTPPSPAPTTMAIGGNDGGSPRRNPRRAAPEPYYARALRPSAASGRTSGNARLDGSSERFI